MATYVDPRITHPTKHRLISDGLASVQGDGSPPEVYADDILDASFFGKELLKAANSEVARMYLQAAPTDLVSSSFPGLMHYADKNKLDGIEDGATANQTDSYLLNRVNHTGTQSISTVSGLQSALDTKVDKVAGKQLSTEDFTSAEKTKLSGIETGATVGATWGTNLSGIPAALTTPQAAGIASIRALGTTATTAKAGDWQPSTATKAKVLEGTSTTDFISADSYAKVISWEDLGSYSSGNITIDLLSSLNFKFSVSGNVNIEAPQNAMSGKYGDIVIVMTSAGSVSWDSNWKFLNSVPVIENEGELWMISYKVLDSTQVIASASKVVN